MIGANAAGALSQRIDKWLWCARLFKTRTLAAKFIADGGVRVTRGGVTRRATKAGFALQLGDQVSYLLDGHPVVLTVTGIAARRGSASAAKSLYAERENLPRPALGAPLPSCKAE